MKTEWVEIICDECEGSGMYTCLLPNGHTELNCPECYGTGVIEVEKEIKENNEDEQ